MLQLLDESGLVPLEAQNRVNIVLAKALAEEKSSGSTHELLQCLISNFSG